MSTAIGFEIFLDASYNQSVIMATEALKSEGGGVLTSIDVRSTIKKKLGNVTVEAVPEGGSIVRIADPDVIMRAGSIEDNHEISDAAREARVRLVRVAEILKSK